MTTISTQFRNFKEPSKDQLLRNFFSLPPLPVLDNSGSEKDGSLPVDRVEINAVRKVLFLFKTVLSSTSV